MEKFNKVSYNNKFIAEKYDRVNLTLPKGRKEQLQVHASEQKESLNSFINRAIDEKIKRDKSKDGE